MIIQERDTLGQIWIVPVLLSHSPIWPNMFSHVTLICSSSVDYSKCSHVKWVQHVPHVITKPPNKCRYHTPIHTHAYTTTHTPTYTPHPPRPTQTHISAVWPFLCFLHESRDAGEAQAASQQELEQRPWLCWRLQGAGLQIKPNKNVWFVAFIFGGCQLQLELARCLEAGWVTNMKDALMNCWQSSVSSLILCTMAAKASTLR